MESLHAIHALKFVKKKKSVFVKGFLICIEFLIKNTEYLRSFSITLKAGEEGLSW